jgi:hypothetical protein
LSAMSLISVQMVLMSWGSVLDRRILALETIPGYLHCRPFVAKSDGGSGAVKNLGVNSRGSRGTDEIANWIRE